MTFVDRLNFLLKTNDISRKEFLEALKFGKNQIRYWEKNGTLPYPSTLDAIAKYFGVSVEYLTGEEECGNTVHRIMKLVVEWLEDNEYEYYEDDNAIKIGSDGDFIHLAPSDFANQCLAIKKMSEDGFELAMQEWCRKNFTVNDSRKIIHKSRNVINDSPNATLLVDNTDLSKQERELVKMYREFSLEDQLKAISYMLELKKGEK